MTTETGFLRVAGTQIVNERGETVRLRGFCLGGWMNMENFIAGYPSSESRVRAAVAAELGEAQAGHFFDRFLHHFITEDDLRFIKSLGCTVVRVSFNYRHFESDDRPFEYKPEGFALLDRVIGWAAAHGLYVILDLHAAPGCQNEGWHSDNSCQESHFWGQKGFEDRVVALWEELARRYRNNPTIAGYNVVNEPQTRPGDVVWLNRFYRRVTAAIRAIDDRHILFLEGDNYSARFDQLDPPFDSNTVYSSHSYPVPALDHFEYPGVYNGVSYDRDLLKKEYLERTAFMRQHGVPHWFGEFGCVYTGEVSEDSRLRVMADMIDIADELGDHWTIWTYKDVGRMGLVCPTPDSEWMRRTAPVRQAKTALRCDSWVERPPVELENMLQGVAGHVREIAGDLPGEWEKLDYLLRLAVCDGLLSRALLPAFAGQFRGMSEDDVDQMMQSFAFQNCAPREGLVRLLRSRLQGG